MADNGYTQKEMLRLVLDGQKEIQVRIDYLHEKINSKPSRAEIIGWLIGFGAIFGGFLGMFN
tara:strand:- start:9888 stop:10073 length:186 start_codon:yes stop_codon:yes gene_type:complete